MLFWVVLGLMSAIAIVCLIVDGLDKSDVKEGLASAGFSLILSGIFATIILGVTCLVASTGNEGTQTVKGTETFKVAEKSQMTVDGSYLKFTYEDASGTLQQFYQPMDGITYEGGKREHVVVQKIEYKVENLMPWDIYASGEKAIIK